MLILEKFEECKKALEFKLSSGDESLESLQVKRYSAQELIETGFIKTMVDGIMKSKLDTKDIEEFFNEFCFGLTPTDIGGFYVTNPGRTAGGHILEIKKTTITIYLNLQLSAFIKQIKEFK